MLEVLRCLLQEPETAFSQEDRVRLHDLDLALWEMLEGDDEELL
jgi:hypothetical protein